MNCKIINDTYEILTNEGFKDFEGLLKSTHNEYVRLTFLDGSSFTCSKDHRVLHDKTNKYIPVLNVSSGMLLSGKLVNMVTSVVGNEEIFYDPINVSDTSSYISSGINSHNCDETSFIRNNLFDEFMDSVMPAMAAIQGSQAIFSSTANGLNHFYHMVEGARKKENGYNLCEAKWQDVPRWHKDGRPKTPDEFKTEQVAKNGLTHFNQNFGNCVGYDTYIDTTLGKIKIGKLYESS